jgi:hypothetical protein
MAYYMIPCIKCGKVLGTGSSKGAEYHEPAVNGYCLDCFEGQPNMPQEAIDTVKRMIEKMGKVGAGN